MITSFKFRVGANGITTGTRPWSRACAARRSEPLTPVSGRYAQPRLNAAFGRGDSYSIMHNQLFEAALGVAAKKTLTILIDFVAGTRFPHPNAAGLHPEHDTQVKRYRHLNFFQHDCYLEVRVPRVKLPDERVVLVEPAWAGKLAGFTLLFEALVLALAQQMPFAAVTRMVGESRHRVHAFCSRYVKLAMAQTDFESGGNVKAAKSSGHCLRNACFTMLMTISAPTFADSYPAMIGYWVGNGQFGIYHSDSSACDSYPVAKTRPNSVTPYWREPGVTCARDCDIKIWDYICGMAALHSGPYCPAGGTPSGNTCINSPSTPSNNGAPSCNNSGPGGNSGGGTGQHRSGNPINPGVGNKYQIESDIPGNGARRFSLTRTYNRSITDHFSLGIGWQHNYERLIRALPTGVIAVWRNDGKIFFFTPDNGIYTAPDTSDALSLQVDGWRYLTSNNVTETYDADGKLTSITEPDGASQTFSYDGPSSEFPVSVTDNFGWTVLFNYTQPGSLTSIVLPDGTAYQYAYDSKRNLTGVTYPDNTVRQYHYEDTRAASALTGITDERGIRYATWQYDSSGRAISSSHAGGADTYLLSYGTNSATITDPLGTQRIYGYQKVNGIAKATGGSQPGGSGCGAASSSQAYDAHGNITSQTDFNGHVTRYSYDLTRNLETQRIEAYGRPEARTISTQWHGYWRMRTRVAEPRRLTTYIYNGDVADGVVVNCAPENAVVPAITGGTRPIGVICRKTEQATTDETGSQGFATTPTGNPRIWSYTYNEYGKVLTEDAPRTDVADVTGYTYYAANDPDLGKRGNLATVTNALGQTTQYLAYDLNGRPLRIVDPAGVVTTLTYDLRGRLTSRTVGEETTSYSYDPVGQLTSITLSDGTSITYTYDDARRLVAVTDSAGNRIEYTLDAAGNRIGEDIYDPSGNLAKSVTRVYDALGRLQSLIGVQ